MDSAQITFTINVGLLAIVQILGYLIFLKNDMRLSRQSTVILLIINLLMAVLCSLPWDSSFPFPVLMTLYLFGFLIFSTKNTVCSCTIMILFINLFSFFGTLLIAFMYSVLTISQGSLKWLIVDQTGIGFHIMMFILYIPSFALAYITVKMFSDEIRNAAGFLKWFLFLLFPVKEFVFDLISDIMTNQALYHNDPSGLKLCLDSINIVILVGSLLLLLILQIRKNRRKYRALKQTETEESIRYQNEVDEMKTVLRQIEHDSTGWQKALTDLDQRGTEASDEQPG